MLSRVRRVRSSTSSAVRFLVEMGGRTRKVLAFRTENGSDKGSSHMICFCVGRAIGGFLKAVENLPATGILPALNLLSRTLSTPA